MPVLVVGADSPAGRRIVETLSAREGEVRAFVSDPVEGESLRERGFRVAVGDPSDDSHIGGASTRVFSAVLITGCVRDGRDLAFAGSPEAVLDGWARALRASGVRRAIWVIDDRTTLDPAWLEATPEHAVLTESAWSASDLAVEVARLDDVASL